MYKLKNYLSRDKIKSELAVLTQDTESFEFLCSLAEKYVREKEYLLCLETLDKIAELYNTTSQLYLNSALCLYRLGEITDAISSLEEALKIDLDNEQALILLGKLKDRLKQMRPYTFPVYG